MSWVSLASGVVKLFNAISRYFEREEYKQAGRNEAAIDGIAEQERRKARANTARTGLISMSDDPNNRDRA